MPPLALMSATTILATFALALPAKPIGPVRSVAIPTLMGLDCPHAGGMIKLPAPVAIAPVQRVVSRKRRRLDTEVKTLVLSWTRMMSAPFARQEPSGPELHEDDGDHEY